MVDPNRRSFLKWCTHGLGALFAIILGAPAVAFVLDPRNRKAPESGLRPVRGIHVSEIPIGTPVQGVIRDLRHDAWTLHPNDVIGRVWIVRNSPALVKASFQVFTTECPHLGCSINLVQEATCCFKCPCHDAEFRCDGTRNERDGYTNAAPRSMDSLDFELARDPDNPDPQNRDLLQVAFQKFINTKEEKIVRA